MKKLLLTIFALFAAFPLLASSILVNGDFSRGAFKWQGKPVIVDTDRGKALKIDSDRRWNSITSTRFYVAAGQKYRFTGLIKLENVSQSHIKINWLKLNGQFITSSFLITGQDGSCEWKELNKVFAAPKDAALAEVTCMAGGTKQQKGTSWFTGFTVVPEDEAAHKKAMEPYAPINENGGFSAKNPVTAWSMNDTYCAIDDKVYALADDGNTKSMRITCQHKWMSAATTINVTENCKYKISLWYKLQNAVQTHVKIGWYDINGAGCGTTYVFGGQDGTTDWKHHVSIITPPKHAAKGSITFMAGGEKGKPGSSWIDELSVVPMDYELHKKETDVEKQIEVKKLPANSMKPEGTPVKVPRMAAKTIIIPANATGQDKHGAELLAKLLGKMYNCELTIVSDRARIGGEFISIGDTMQARNAGVKSNPDLFGYVIDVRSNNIYLQGGRWGSLYAVLALLQEDLGCRFYTADEPIYVPQVTGDTAAVVPRSYTPPFEMREPLISEYAGRDDYNSFNRVQSASYFKPLPENMGGGFANTRYFIHTYSVLVPEHLFDTHPEYFPVRNGKRFRATQKEGQLCYSNPEVADFMASQLMKAVDKKPNSRIYSISQNDNVYPECECAECTKLAKLDGIPGLGLLLANRVAERMVKKLPDIRITTLAYVETQAVPKNIKPHDNTVIFYAPIRERAGVMGYLPWEKSEKIMDELRGWDKVTRHIYVWDYPRNSYPFPFLDQQSINIDTWRKNGVTGVFLEDLEFNLNNLARLQTWVFMQKLWNPDWDLDALIEDYIAGHYGESAPEMREYVKLQRDCWKKFYASWKPGDINTMQYSAAELKRMQELLDKAYAKTPNTDIAREICCINASLLKACKRNAVAEYEARMNRTLQLLEKHNIRLYTVGDTHQKTIADWKEQLHDAKHGADFPLYHENSLILKKAIVALHHNSVQKEPGSYMPTVYKQVRKTDWGLQWVIDKLMASVENQSRYVVRIRVKPHFTADHDPNADAFGLHLWRSGFSATATQGKNIKFKDLKNNEWQYIYLYKAYFYSPSVYGYFYSTIGDIKEDEYMLYDLIEFIPLEHFKDKKFADSLPEIII